MIGRGKRSRPSQRLKEEDRISELPDGLICQVLSHLSTKEVVKTSVLSKRWRTLWLWVPKLDLDSRAFPGLDAFVKFGDRFFDSDRASCIHKLNLTVIDENNKGGDDGTSYYHKSWIVAAVKRKVQHVHVQLQGGNWDFHEMPTSVFNCQTLVSLKLHSVKVNLDDVGFVSLPCLKTMHLKYFCLNEASFERLVSCCPVLEELKISKCLNVLDEKKVFRVISRSLKKLIVQLFNFGHAYGTGFVVDAPRLRFLSVVDNLSESFVVKNMDSNAKLDISLSFRLNVFDEATLSSRRRSSIRRFLSGISKVREMTLCPYTFELICHYSKLEPLPQFGYISSLHLNLFVVAFQWFPTFLKSFPDLKSLTLTSHGDLRVAKQPRLSSVPECLLSSLEFFYFNVSIWGASEEIMLLSYILRNSAILKKLIVRLSSDSSREYLTLKSLLKIPRGSTKCQVVVL